MDVIPGARPQDAIAVLELPGLAVVVAAIEPALAGHGLGLDDRVNAVRAAGRDIDADFANHLR